MPIDRTWRLRHRATCYTLSALLLVGCTRWRVQDVFPEEVLATQPDRVRITLADRSRLELHRPQLVADTIYDGRARHGMRRQVPLGKVREVALRKWDPLGTAALTVGTAAVGAVIAIGAVWSSRAD